MPEISAFPERSAGYRNRSPKNKNNGWGSDLSLFTHTHVVLLFYGSLPLMF